MGARMPLAAKLSPAHTGLLVVDMQRDFAAPDGALAKGGRDMRQVPGMLANVHRLIAAAEQAGVPVYYTQQIYDRSKLNARQLEQYDLDGKYVTCDVAGDGWHLHEVQAPADRLFVKHDYNAFSNPELLPCLEKDGVKTLVIVGMDTIYCIETAIRNGFDLGFKIVVPQDAIAGNGKHLELHNHTLRMVEKTYGVVTDAATVCALWGKVVSPLSAERPPR